MVDITDKLEQISKMVESVESFVSGFIKKIGYEMEYADFSDELIELWNNQKSPINFQDLVISIVRLCKAAEKNIILLIDEVDKSSNNQIFVNFLGMLREYELESQRRLLLVAFFTPILNGTGHYVLESWAKDKTRMDRERRYKNI